MNYITATQLRTKTTDLFASISAGQTTHILHRSRIVAIITPVDQTKPKPFDGEAYLKFTKNLKIKKTSDAQRKKNYDEYIQKKYGKHIS